MRHRQLPCLLFRVRQIVLFAALVAILCCVLCSVIGCAERASEPISPYVRRVSEAPTTRTGQATAWYEMRDWTFGPWYEAEEIHKGFGYMGYTEQGQAKRIEDANHGN